MHINDLEVGQYYMFVFKHIEHEDILVRLHTIHGQHDLECTLVSLDSIDIYETFPVDPRSLRELTSDEYIKHIIKPAARNFGSKLYDFLDQLYKAICKPIVLLWEGIVTFVTLVRCNIWDIHEITWVRRGIWSDSDHEYYKSGFCKHCGKHVTLGEGDHSERLR